MELNNRTMQCQFAVWLMVVAVFVATLLLALFYFIIVYAVSKCRIKCKTSDAQEHEKINLNVFFSDVGK